MRLTRNQLAEAKEYYQEALKRKANLERCTDAAIVIATFREIAQKLTKQINRDRVEQLANQIENHCASGGADLDVETTKKLKAYVQTLISKEK